MPGYGKRTPEQRERMRQARLGKRASKQARENMSAAQQGRVITAPHAAAISAALTGRTRKPFTPAHREAMSNSWTEERRAAQAERMREIRKRTGKGE